MLRRRNHAFVYYILVGVKCGVLTIGHRNLCPEALGTPTTAVPHVKRDHLAACGIHCDPDPLLVRLLLHKAAHFIRFHLQVSNHALAVAGDGLDVEMIRQRLNTVTQKAQEPLETHTDGATNAAQGNPFHQQALDERTCVIRDEVLFEAVDKLTAAVVAVMVLFAVMNEAIFLILGGLAPRTHISDDHSVLLTSTGWIRVCGSTVAQHRQASITWSALPPRVPRPATAAPTGAPPYTVAMQPRMKTPSGQVRAVKLLGNRGKAAAFTAEMSGGCGPRCPRTIRRGSTAIRDTH
jgi:hypothetical protein